MDDGVVQEVRQNIAGVRALLVPFVALAGLGAIQLFVFPNDTDRFFAWTLRPSMSAMFMGAGYAAGVVLTVLSYRRQPWVVTRTATVTVFVFVVFMTVATFLHLDKMHLSSDVLTARAAAWLWVGVYVVVPPALLGIIVAQVRQRGVDPPRTAPLPTALRIVLGVTGVSMTALGLVMFASPATAAGFWPWEVTPLAARALASWVIAIGWAGIEAVYENDVRRTRPAAATFAVLGALWLLAVLRGADDFLWDRPSAVVFVAAAGGAAALGLWGLALARSEGAGSVPTAPTLDAP